MKCQLKNEIYCRGTNVRQYQGTKKGDPKFWACWGCVMWMHSQKIKFKEVEPCPKKKRKS